ncbi:MarR family winged helix-turn-helix transcriptional regulator [Reichenbachiella ulvae]|uniref:MarR family transcriptional regulator n=1 Tax=Reichenbachiella ulvae TaxID=2980104 RepID=A0ABT3CRC7_9BACT|nr:MarR family transcriptional regulator [Reichenbachiella ulvae]MCV9386040.1 MarR family transcriptional regulator [Reichenbachiella ulvae]
MGLNKDIKQVKFRSEFDKVVVNLMFTSNWLKQQEFYLFKPFGLTTQQYNTLRILRGQYPKPATINLIIERMLDRMSNASRIVDKLVLKGLVTRETNDSDRRAVDVKINEKGLKLLEEMDAKLMEMTGEINQFSEEECKKMNDFLDRFRGTEPD